MPGVPPNTGGLVKKVFKGLFKRGKKGEDADSQASLDSQQYTQPPSSSGVNADTSAARLSPTQNFEDTTRYSRVSDKPPQLDDPISTGSPLTVEPSSRLPGTEPSSATSGTAVAPTKEVERLKEADAKPDDVSAIGVASTGDPVSSTPVSALEDTNSMRPPSKVENTSDGRLSGDSKQLDGTTREESSPSQKQYATQTAPRIDPSTSAPDNTATPPAVPAKDDVPRMDNISQAPQPQAGNVVNGSATPPAQAVTESKHGAEAGATSDAVVQQPDADTERPGSPMDDLPEIKQVQAAPGMSATSGPLEDYFPETGDSSQHDRLRAVA